MNQIPALHLDHYDLNMPYAWWKLGMGHRRVLFNVYFRRHPFHGGFSVFAGLERIVHYIENLRFTEEEIDYLRQRPEQYDEAFLSYLSEFRFTGNIDALREGEVIFPEVPLLKVEADLVEALIIEAALLNIVNWHSPVATRAARMREVVGEGTLIEMATRRMPEADAAVWAARSAYIGGFDSTSNTLAEVRFGVPAAGTMGHAWIQSFDNELEAFRAFVKVFPDSSILLVDTYDTLRSGIPNAITVAKELEQQGHRLIGIRLDSGDLAYLSIQARKMLDEAGLDYVQIVATSDLNEDIIAALKEQGAHIDSWGVGTSLAQVGGALGAVYKMKATEMTAGEEKVPVIKISENVEKTTLPGDIVPYRIVDKETGMAKGDYLVLHDETPAESRELEMLHPVHAFKRKTVTDFVAQPLLVPIFRDGQRVYYLPKLSAVKEYHTQQLALFWPEYRRRINPEEYHVSLSPKLWNLKKEMIRAEQLR